jgi:uncharacterized tellurite resistance protein B-like protein
MASLSAEDRFNIEVIKLLLQIAWSDRQVSPKERLVILAMGRSWSVPEGELHTLLDLLQAGGEMPQPDMEVLRARPDDVMEAARALVAADNSVAPDEKALLLRIGVMLGVSA